MNLGTLEFVLMSSTGSLASSRGDGLDSEVETILMISFSPSFTFFLTISGLSSSLPSPFARHHCFLVLCSGWLEYHLKTSFPKFQSGQSSDSLCFPVEYSPCVMGGWLLCAWVDSSSRCLLSVLKYLCFCLEDWDVSHYLSNTEMGFRWN